MIRIYFAFVFLLFSVFSNAQNPRIKIDYKVQRGTIKSFNTSTMLLGITGGACTESGTIEIRVHARFKSNSGPANGSNGSYAATNTCPSGTCATCATGDAAGWSCEQRCENVTNGANGVCGTWIPNGSQNASYPGDPGPGYIDTSNYPCADILSIRLNGYEADNGLSSAAANCNNVSDGACGGVVPYGTPVDVTSGSNIPIDIGSATNTLIPFKGSNWSTIREVSITDNRCTSDGITLHYHSRWRYRWCWDSTTLTATHAGLIKFPATKEVCSGSTVSVNDSTQAFEASRGFSEYQWQYSTDGTNWFNISGASAKDLSTTSLTNITVNPINYNIRRAGLFCADFKPTSYRMYPVYTNSQIVIVYPQPVAPTFYSSSPGNGSTLCKGTYTYAQFDPGTGGYTDAIDEFQYSINGGSIWNTYIPGSSINTATASTSVQIRGRHTAGTLSTCTPSAWVVLATWPVSTQATPASISTSSPIVNTAICLGDNVSANFNAGSGGTGDEFRYSVDNGANWNTYTPGANINTSSASVNIIVQTRRTGATAPCLPSPWTAIGTWPVVANPTPPTLNSQNPVGSTINTGEQFQALANSGSGGATDASDEFRYSTDNGISWNAYTNNSNITVPTGANQIIIQGRRISGNSTCPNSSWSTLTQWTVNSILPVELVNFYGFQDNNGENILIWQTASERNTAEFVVLKSTDMINWVGMTTLNATGNSTIIKTYQCADNSVSGEINYYKLKIIDQDLSYSYSPMIAIKNEIKNQSIALNIYPIPFENELNLNIINPKQYKVWIELVDITGKTIYQNNFNTIESDITISTIELPKGVYVVKLYCGENTILKKIIK